MKEISRTIMKVILQIIMYYSVIASLVNSWDVSTWDTHTRAVLVFLVSFVIYDEVLPKLKSNT